MRALRRFAVRNCAVRLLASEGLHGAAASFSGAACCAAILGCCGCLSVEYTDRRDVRHVIGFMDVAIQQPTGIKGGGSFSGVSTTALGLAVYADGAEKGVALGYVKNTFLSLGNGACLDLQMPGPCANSANIKRQRGIR